MQDKLWMAVNQNNLSKQSSHMGFNGVFMEFQWIYANNFVKKTNIFRLDCNTNVYTRELVWYQLTTKVSTNES